MKTHASKVEGQPGGTSTTGQQIPGSTSKDVPAASGNVKDPGATATNKDQTSISMQSQLTSSLLETSEDEEAKRKAEEKLAKKNKKGLTEKEIEALIDIELGETETFDLLFIPSSLVQNDT